MIDLDTIRKPIEGHLETYRQAFDQTLQHENPILKRGLDHLLHQHGKMLRPTLVMLSAKLYGEVNERVMDVAVALELLHTASLVHDDVVDESDTRRGQDSVNKLLSNQVAVLVGDYVLSRAIHHVAATGLAEVVECVAQLGQTLADGELLQMHHVEVGQLEESAYFDVVTRKTASLLAACSHLGVIAAGGTADQAERMRQFGHLAGICFQIKDDIFDFLGTKTIGKPSGQDLREGKLTLPVLSALRHHPDEEMKSLAHKVQQGKATEEDISRLSRFTLEQGGLQFAQVAMDEFRVMADGLIDDRADAEAAESLHQLLEFIVQRDH